MTLWIMLFSGSNILASKCLGFTVIPEQQFNYSSVWNVPALFHFNDYFINIALHHHHVYIISHIHCFLYLIFSFLLYFLHHVLFGLPRLLLSGFLSYSPNIFQPFNSLLLIIFIMRSTNFCTSSHIYWYIQVRCDSIFPWAFIWFQIIYYFIQTL